MKVFIIILNWNGKNHSLKCLKSLKQVKTEHQIIVVDNGSTDGSVLSIKTQFPSVLIIETNENLGYAEGNNVGIRYALENNADYIFILNNDTTVEPTILSAFLKNPTLPIQGAKPLLMDQPNLLDHLGGNWNPKRGEFDLVGAGDSAEKWTQSITLDYICGVALFVKAEVFKKVGFFDKRFFLFWEESDWCFRAKNRGFNAVICPKAKLYHKVSASFTGGKPHTTYFWWRNRLLWIEKNCSLKEKFFLYVCILLPKITQTLKLYILRTLFSKKTPERQKKNQIYRAALVGVKDYFARRFGNGPSWVFQKIGDRVI